MLGGVVVEPFRIDVADEVLDELRARLRHRDLPRHDGIPLPLHQRSARVGAFQPRSDVEKHWDLPRIARPKPRDHRGEGQKV